jgi:CBS-domain-containing membrane protein
MCSCSDNLLNNAICLSFGHHSMKHIGHKGQDYAFVSLRGSFSRYDFRVLPVTDEKDRMAGVVRYPDVTKLMHHFLE